MKQPSTLTSLVEPLLAWYESERRPLPWRDDVSPYHIWLSEIMLQQTRIEAVIPYYERFLSVYPTVAALAAADDEQLMKLWEGLGYYSRARNLKKAAVRIVEQHGGELPADYNALRALPGIGAYTAGAIASIAFGLPVAAVDGNVLRLISRLTDDDTPIDLPAYKKQVQEALRAVYPARAGDFTQALMELGATVCGPDRKPDCANCPCNGFCMGNRNQTAERLPVKLPKRQRRAEDRTVFILSCGGHYALEKRENKGLLAGLWQFPNLQQKLDTDGVLLAVEEMGLKPVDLLRIVERKHVFTHVEWDMRGVYIEVADLGGNFTWLARMEIEEQTALPTAFRQFWEEINNV